MMQEQDVKDPTIAYLLLRDGHAVPIKGLSPTDLKLPRGAVIVREGFEELRRTSELNAIVDCLGFRGDWGDYQRTHWPQLQAFMERHGLVTYRNLFESGILALIGAMHRQRRALADRLFLGPEPRPTRVFTGMGIDWESWEDKYFYTVQARGMVEEDCAYVPEDLEETRRWFYARRFQADLVNFVGDHLLDIGEDGEVVLMMYAESTMSAEEREIRERLSRKVAEVFRWYIQNCGQGWVDVLPYNDRLIFLKGPDGQYDFVWRDLRETPPPIHYGPDQNPRLLHPLDVPSVHSDQLHFDAWNYYRRDAWAQKEAHEAETHYYAKGNSALGYPGAMVVLRGYLQDTGAMQEIPRIFSGDVVPAGFRQVTQPDGQRLLVSELISIEQMQEMMRESGYVERRVERRKARNLGDDSVWFDSDFNKLWEPGNSDDEPELPSAVTWYDAQAYCAWMEKSLGCQVRLPTADEYQVWFPESDGKRALLQHPVSKAPGGVERVWSSGDNEKNLYGDPERLRFVPDLQWVSSAEGLRAVHAYNVFEWVLNNKQLVLSPYSNTSCAPHTWGAHKTMKVCFRVVLELERPGQSG